MLLLQDLHDFSVSTWYNIFKNICIKTHYIEIPETLIKKLSSGDMDYELEEVINSNVIYIMFSNYVLGMSRIIY